MNRLVLFAACAGLLVACVACDLGEVPPPLGPPNVLGQVCDTDNPCPIAPAVHTCITLSIGSQTQGYCSPNCTVDEDCQDGYSGPLGGTPYCVNPSRPNTCTIQCASVVDCPTGLDCVAAEGPTSFCVVPSQSLLPQVKTPDGSV